MFSLREINQMEREMCNYLDWELTVDNPILGTFERQVLKDFSQDRAFYPNYPLVFVSKRAARAAASTTATPVPEPSVTTTAIPNFGQHHRQTPSASRPDPTPTHPPHRSSTSSTANTPSPSHSNTTSPAPTAPPQTPNGIENNSARIHGVDDSPTFSCIDSAPSVHSLMGQMFAFAVPSKYYQPPHLRSLVSLDRLRRRSFHFTASYIFPASAFDTRHDIYPIGPCSITKKRTMGLRCIRIAIAYIFMFLTSRHHCTHSLHFALPMTITALPCTLVTVCSLQTKEETNLYYLQRRAIPTGVLIFPEPGVNGELLLLASWLTCGSSGGVKERVSVNLKPPAHLTLRATTVLDSPASCITLSDLGRPSVREGMDWPRNVAHSEMLRCVDSCFKFDACIDEQDARRMPVGRRFTPDVGSSSR
ncbi:hypothetical protein NMY22_g17429 [Coprinellus aureogranulatus]|nr:hypothetical protein NMY22_g17429 [Coprinellus aureogranulatus]